jgi:broad specificity phosphatase PhoE
VLLLLRHGEAVGNAEGLLLGRMESSLTDKGRLQVERLRSLVSAMGPVARVISSPLERARRTAEALDLGIDVEVDERWTEVDYGRFDGEKLSEMPAEVWRAWRRDPGYRPAGGETLVELGMRVRAACDQLFSEDGKGARAQDHVVVVSHVSPIKAAVGWALGVDEGTAWRMWLATASMSVVGWGAGTPMLRRYNVVPLEDMAI